MFFSEFCIPLFLKVCASFSILTMRKTAFKSGIHETKTCIPQWTKEPHVESTGKAITSHGVRTYIYAFPMFPYDCRAYSPLIIRNETPCYKSTPWVSILHQIRLPRTYTALLHRTQVYTNMLIMETALFGREPRSYFY